MASGPLAIHLSLFHKGNYCPQTYRWGKWATEKLGPSLRVTQVFDFNRISPKTASLSGVLAQELNPQIYSPFAQPEDRGNGQVEMEAPPGDRWVDTQTPVLQGKPKPRELSTGVMSISLPAWMETWTFGTDTQRCGWNPPPHIHQSSHNREGKAASGYLDHLGDCPWAAIALFSAQQYKTCLWKKYILAKTLLLVRCEGWWGGGFHKVGWRNRVLSVVSSSNVWFGFKTPLCSAFSALPTKSPHKSVYHQIAFWLLSHTTCTLQIPRPGLCPTGSSISSYEDKMSVAAEKFSPMLFTLFTVQYWYITILHLIIINNDT